MSMLMNLSSLLGFALAISSPNWEDIEDHEDIEHYQQKTSFNT